MPSKSTCPVPIGARVELHGLKAKPQLNGQSGVVVDYMELSGRCTVALEDDGAEIKMNIKLENLEWN